MRENPLVITVHGVNPNRVWQANVHKVLSPHFDCKRYDYTEYDTIRGPFRVVFDIRTAVASLTLAAVAVVLGIVHWYWGSVIVWWTAATLLIVALILFGFSLFLAWHKRIDCAQHLKLEFDTVRSLGERPHVIAHSLGTYLVGRALKKFPDFDLGHIVLVSTVLPRRYPWRKILAHRPRCVTSVRSEFGRADLVVRGVRWIRWLAWDLGTAGAYGFKVDPSCVHTNDSPTLRCSLCVNNLAPVHNIPLGEFTHSDAFLGVMHARNLWLPFLWGYDPDEYSYYLEKCREAAGLHKQRRWPELDAVANELWGRKFTWTRDNTLQQFLERQVARSVSEHQLKRHLSVSIPRVVSATKWKLYSATDEACSASDDANDLDSRALLGLHPPFALARAVEDLIAELE
jgi:pimeloyl-ACP methyl ester carboxylesterase